MMMMRRSDVRGGKNWIVMLLILAFLTLSYQFFLEMDTSSSLSLSSLSSSTAAFEDELPLRFSMVVLDDNRLLLPLSPTDPLPEKVETPRFQKGQVVSYFYSKKYGFLDADVLSVDYDGEVPVLELKYKIDGEEESVEYDPDRFKDKV